MEIYSICMRLGTHCTVVTVWIQCSGMETLTKVNIKVSKILNKHCICGKDVNETLSIVRKVHRFSCTVFSVDPSYG